MKTTLSKEEFKLQEIQQAISELAAGNFDHRAVLSDEGEESDAVLLGLNMLAEELESQRIFKENASRENLEKEQSLSMILHAIDDDLALIDFELDRLITCNRQFEEKLLLINPNYTIDALKRIKFGFVLSQIIDLLCDDKTKVFDLISEASKHRRSLSVYLRPTIDGEKKSYELFLHPIDGSNGKKMLWRCKDLTKQHQAIARLKVSEKNLKQAEKISHIGHWTFDIKTGTIDWSDELCRIFGIETVTNPSFDQYIAMIHPDDRESLTQVIHNCMAEKGTYDIHHRIITPDNKVKHVQCKGGCIISESGELEMMLGTSHDISDKELLDEKARISEARMREAQSVAKMGDWVWYPEEDSSEWSDALFDIYDLSPEDGIPRFDEYIKMIHPEDVQEFRDFLEVMSMSTEATEHSFRIITAKGNQKVLRLIGAKKLGGKTQILSGTVQDISAIKDAQDRIRESEKRLELALNASNTGIFEFKFANKDLYWDAISKNIYGYSDLEKESPYSFMTRVSSQGDKDRIKHTFEDLDGVSRRGNHSDSYIISVAGSQKHITTTAVVLRDGKGRPQRMVGTIRDITLQVLHDRLVRDMNSQLEKSNRNLLLTNTHLEEIAHVSSHDLKAPLLNLTALLKLINPDTLDDGNAILLEKASESVVQMKETLNVISKVLEVQYGSDLLSEKVNIQDVYLDVAKQIDNQISENRAQIQADFSKLPVLWYPRFHLTSILQNLLTNAIKYKQLDLDPIITLETRIESNRPVLVISDNGLGINLDLHREKLFRLFKRFHDHVPGKGVGLHIVHSIVNSHGGDIEINSEPNKGTTFKLTLSNERSEGSENSAS
jgi:PAS domain S-box-containing protein